MTRAISGPQDIEALIRQEELHLVQRLFFSPAQDAPHVVVFTGVGHGTGCSRICARSSEVLAAEGAGSVCVVDASVRPFLHVHFGTENRWGWEEALAQPDPIQRFAQPIPPSDLWLVPRGVREGPLPLALKGDRVRSRMAELRARFRYVLIDAPPVNQSADLIQLAAPADGVVLVLEAYVTRRETARHARDSVTGAGSRLIGVVLNKRTFPVPDALYRYC